MLFRKAPRTPRIHTGVSATLTADHRSREGIVHGHTWEITAWFCSDGQDALALRYALERVLAPHQGKCLPDRIAWAEQMASWLAHELEDARPQRITIRRDAERLYAEWIAE